MTREPRWMPLASVLRYEAEAARRGVSEVARGPRGFLTAYKAAKTRARLDPWWRTRRAAFVSRHVTQAEARGEPWTRGGTLTRRALALIMWAYDPRRP